MSQFCCIAWIGGSKMLASTEILVVSISTTDSSDKLRKCFSISKPHIRRIGLARRPLSA
jgi:hypothetical protein